MLVRIFHSEWSGVMALIFNQIRRAGAGISVEENVVVCADLSREKINVVQ